MKGVEYGEVRRGFMEKDHRGRLFETQEGECTNSVLGCFTASFWGGVYRIIDARC